MDSTLPIATQIDLRRERDAGGVINTAFELLRENWSGLWRAMVYLVGPVFLALLVMQTLLSSGSSFALANLVSVARSFVIGTVANVVIVGYVLLYMERGRDGVELSDVRTLLKSDIMPVIGALILTYAAVGLASILLLIPGIYLIVATSLVVPVLMAEETTVSSAISRSIDLVRGYWWPTAGLVLLGVIIGLALGMLSAAPTYLVAWTAPEALLDESGGSTLLVVITTVIEDFATVMASLVVDLILAVHYFNLVERKEGPGMLARIGEIGEPMEEVRS